MTSSRPKLFSDASQLELAREVIHAQAEGLVQVGDGLNDEFCHAVRVLHECRGVVFVVGIGKAGLIGKKIAATLTSLGSRSIFLHPSEALHGDLGAVEKGDAALVLSRSGETEENLRLVQVLLSVPVPVIAITATRASRLGRAASVTVELGDLSEAGPLGVVPTTSTTAMLALGDALAVVLSRLRGFGEADFAQRHPGGHIGLALTPVGDAMRPLEACRVAADSETVREVLVTLRGQARRSGAILLLDGDDRLSGIFTDSDLARLVEARRDDALDRPIAEVMTRRPVTVPLATTLAEAVAILAQHKISELPVLDSEGRPKGLLDVTDVVGQALFEP